MPDFAGTLEAARAIAEQKPSISYPSGVAAEHVRSVVRRLIACLEQARPTKTASARRPPLARRDDPWGALGARVHPEVRWRRARLRIRRVSRRDAGPRHRPRGRALDPAAPARDDRRLRARAPPCAPAAARQSR